MRPPREDTQPWYKQFWPWFLISLPLSVVIASMYTINLAIESNDGLVSDDYYKEGLGIHKNAESTARAKTLGIAGNLAYDADTGAINLALDKQVDAMPIELSLEVTHPTMANRDQAVSITRVDATTYAGRLETLGEANWQLEVQPTDGSWRVRGRLSTPADSSARVE